MRQARQLAHLIVWELMRPDGGSIPLSEYLRRGTAEITPFQGSHHARWIEDRCHLIACITHLYCTATGVTDGDIYADAFAEACKMHLQGSTATIAHKVDDQGELEEWVVEVQYGDMQITKRFEGPSDRIFEQQAKWCARRGRR